MCCGFYRDIGGRGNGGKLTDLWVKRSKSHCYWAGNLTLTQCPSPLKIIIEFQWTVRKPDEMLLGGFLGGEMGKATYCKLTSYPGSVTCWEQASYQGKTTTCNGVHPMGGGGEGDNVTSPLMLQRVKLNVKVGLQLSRLYLFFFFSESCYLFDMATWATEHCLRLSRWKGKLISINKQDKLVDTY